MDDLLKLIKSRRSIRHFKPEPPSDELVYSIIEAGIWAPSGLNNQPWSFAVVRDEKTKDAVAEQTRYGRIIQEAPALIAVFLDNSKIYDRTKDCQAIGACIQNMLLYIHSAGLGAVWLGEILRNRDKVAKLLDAPDDLELMAVIAFGYPSGEDVHEGRREPVDDSVFRRDRLPGKARGQG